MAAIRKLDLELTEKGIRLRKLRELADFTQEAVARHLGYGGDAASHISRFESGERGMPAKHLEATARFLCTSPLLVNDWEYVRDYLNLDHADLRGCIASHPRLSLVMGEANSDGDQGISQIFRLPLAS